MKDKSNLIESLSIYPDGNDWIVVLLDYKFNFTSLRTNRFYKISDWIDFFQPDIVNVRTLKH